MTMQIHNDTEWTDESISKWVRHLLGPAPWVVRAAVFRACYSWTTGVKVRVLGTAYANSRTNTVLLNLPSRGACKGLHSGLEALASLDGEHLAMQPQLHEQLSAALLASDLFTRAIDNVSIGDPLWLRGNHVLKPKLPNQIPALYMLRRKPKQAPEPMNQRLVRAQARLAAVEDQMHRALIKHTDRMAAYERSLACRRAAVALLTKRQQGEG